LSAQGIKQHNAGPRKGRTCALSRSAFKSLKPENAAMPETKLELEINLTFEYKGGNDK